MRVVNEMDFWIDTRSATTAPVSVGASVPARRSLLARIVIGFADMPSGPLSLRCRTHAPIPAARWR